MDHEPWAITLEGDLAFQRAGTSAAERARMHAAEKGRLRRWIDRVRDVKDDERAWRVGAEGERTVARQLERLPESWTVLHDLPIGSRGANLDHLVIGRAGVLSLNTKHHPGAEIVLAPRTLRINGYRSAHLPRAVEEGERVARALGAAIGSTVAVRPVVAIVGAASWSEKSRPVDVDVIGCGDLVRRLLELPLVLSAEQAAEVTKAARRPSTWAGGRPLRAEEPSHRPSTPTPLDDAPLDGAPTEDPEKSADGAPTQEPVTLRRWQRYGHHRVYVNRGDQRLGWLDVVRNEVVCEHDRDVVLRALADHGCAVPGAPTPTNGAGQTSG